MKKVLCILISMVMTVATVTVASCDGTEEPVDQVTVQLKWIHQAQFAGIYAADIKGFYAEENIDVTIKPGGPEISNNIVTDLVKGDSDFAIIAGDRHIRARSDGEPLTAIAVIFQRNPYVYISLKESKIQHPQDLVGKKIMVAPDGEILHSTILKKLAIDSNTIDTIPFKRDTTPLITGQIDAHMAYRTGLGLNFDETGYELNYIWVEEYGIHFYVDTIVATEQLIQQDPDLVERFLRATMKGWRYAIENPAEAVDMTLQHDATLDRDYQVGMMAAHTPITHTGKAEIGWMEDKVWQEMHQMLLDGGALAQPINVAEVYTMQFLNKIYGEAD